jgi:hypothetical protein
VIDRPSTERPDRGAILIIVLVVSVVLSLVVVGIATYATATLRLGRVVEESSDRIAAAEGGLDWALDRYDRGFTNCGSGIGEELSVFQGEINGLRPTVRCTLIGAGLVSSADYAVVITGEGVAASGKALLTITGGGSSGQAQKTFVGPMYMERLTFNMLADLDIEEGWLLHHEDGCAEAFTETTPGIPNEITFTTPGRGTFCTPSSWTDLFGPNEPTPIIPTTPIDPQPIVDPNGCQIWSPGRYETAPEFASPFVGNQPTYNYFISGNYHFANVGEIELKGAYVLAGYPGSRGPNIIQLKPQDTFDNHPCREAWWYDGFEDVSVPGQTRGDRLGATFYMGGTSSIFVSAGSAIEISGRRQAVTNSADARVSLQALSGANASTLVGEQEILTTKSGSGSQLSMNGLVWAPNASFTFRNIANDVVAALRGGAVVATLDASAAAQTDNFLIEVSSQPSDTQLLIESTATNSGTATVRAVVDYQPSPAEVTLISRRVIDITPEP